MSNAIARSIRADDSALNTAAHAAARSPSPSIPAWRATKTREFRTTSTIRCVSRSGSTESGTARASGTSAASETPESSRIAELSRTPESPRLSEPSATADSSQPNNPSTAASNSSSRGHAASAAATASPAVSATAEAHTSRASEASTRARQPGRLVVLRGGLELAPGLGPVLGRVRPVRELRGDLAPKLVVDLFAVVGRPGQDLRPQPTTVRVPGPVQAPGLDHQLGEILR